MTPQRSSRSSGSTHTVCKKKNRCDFRSIQAAVNAADAGDTIKVRRGVYKEAVRINGRKKRYLKLIGDPRKPGRVVLDGGKRKQNGIAVNDADEVTVSGRNTTHVREKDRLLVKLPEPIAAGRTFSTRIAYHGDLLQLDGADPNGFEALGGFLVKQRNSDKKRIFSSLSWPSKARRWLPLRDHPRDGGR